MSETRIIQMSVPEYADATGVSASNTWKRVREKKSLPAVKGNGYYIGNTWVLDVEVNEKGEPAVWKESV